MFSKDAHFKSVGLIELMCDASFAYFNSEHSEKEGDDYAVNRYARTSILSSALCIECFADCLISTIERSEEYVKLERISTLKRLSKCLERSHREPLNLESAEYIAIEELMKLRNGFVHIKISTIATEVTRDNPHPLGAPQWAAMISAEKYPILGIEKTPLAWHADDALKILRATDKFIAHILARFDPFSAKRIRKGLVSRFGFGDLSVPFLPESYKLELERVRNVGVNFLDSIDAN
jgi:hypothetical protein